MDLRSRVVAAAAHQTQAVVAARFAVSESTVYKWCRRARETGSRRSRTPAARLRRWTSWAPRSCAPAALAFAEYVLVPALRTGQVVVMDNLAPHKAARVREPVEGAGCRLLFLPPCSPDLDPVEPAWSKPKTPLRGVGARTTKALHTAPATLVDAITASHFRHCGYAVQ